MEKADLNTSLEKANAEDIIERKIYLQKALAQKDYSKVIKILKYLQRLEMNKEVLARTLIGKSISPLVNLKTPADQEGEIKEIA